MEGFVAIVFFKVLNLWHLQLSKYKSTRVYQGFLAVIVILLLVNQCNAQQADTTKRQIISLENLNPEDSALLEQLKAEFDQEVKDIKASVLYKKLRPIDTTVAMMNNSSHAEIGLDFTSRILSNGRSSGVKGVGFYPSAMYYHKTGFYASLSMAFFTDSTIRHSAKVPAIYLTPGFYRTFFKWWTFGTGYTRSFVTYGNDFQRGLLNNTFSLYNSVNCKGYLTISVGASISWSSNLNNRKVIIRRPLQPQKNETYRSLTQKLGQGYTAGVTVSLKKDFSFYNVLGAKVFSITPELLFVFGRDNNAFIQTQYIRGLNQKTDTTYRLAYDNMFGFLNLEPALTANWRIKNLEIYAAFRCAIPFNEFVQENGVAGRVTNPHHYYPYAEAGVKYLFRVARKSKTKRQ